MTRRAWLPVAIFTAVAVFALAPHIFPMTQVSAATYAYGDSAYSLWSFWWTDHALLNGKNPFFTDYLFHPTGTSLSFHQYALSYSLLSIPIQHVIPGPEGLAVAFNCLLLLSFVLAGWGAYQLALHSTGSEPGAYVAGLLYTLAPYHLLNAPRTGVMAIEVVPFYVLALFRLADQPTLRRAGVLSVCLAFSFYTSLEYTLYLVLFSGLWLAHSGLKGRVDRALVNHLLVAGAFFTVFASPLLVQQFATLTAESGAVGGKLMFAERWSPALISFFTPSRAQPVYGELFSFLGSYDDGRTWGMRNETSLCLTGWFLAVVSLRHRWPDRTLWLVGAVLFLLLALGPYLRVTGTWTTEIPMPYLALYHLFPPVHAVKETSRMLPIALLALSMLGAYGVKFLGERLEGQRSLYMAMMGLLCFLIIFENLSGWPWSSLPKMQLQQTTGTETPNDPLTPCCDPFYEKVAQEAGDFSVMVVSRRETYSVLAQTMHGRRAAEWHGFVPRAAASEVATPLNILHHDVLDPSRMSKRGEERQAGLEGRVRRDLRAADVRYLVAPGTTGTSVRSLLQRLGATLRDEGRLLVAEFPTVNSIPGASAPRIRSGN